MRRFEFTVEGELPPKKDGANSMWAKSAEVPRLIKLRAAAVNAMAGQSPLAAHICLELELHVSASRGRERGGDLDNFISGICDGLMRANERIARDERWDEPALAAIRPSVTVAIEDDLGIISIIARKVSDDGPIWYKITLEGE